MAQPYLIAVGGSGQNVLASYLRLAKLAGFTPAPFYVVDSDTKGPQFEAVSELKRGVTGVVGGNMPQRWDINPFPIRRSDRRSFGELFGDANPEARNLFECLFSAAAERTTIRTGMYGRPAIGSTAIRLKFREQDDDDLRELKQTLQGGEKRIILVGSCFGGTGSGGVPILAQEFARLNREPGFNLKVHAIIFLPWFRLVLPEGDTASDDKLLHRQLNENFEPNAAASINFFKNNIRNLVETMVLLGVRDPSSVSRTSRESQQYETIHPLNLLGGVLVQNIFRGSIEAPRGIVGYWYDSEKGLDPSHLEIARDDGMAPIAFSATIRRITLRATWLGLLRSVFVNLQRIPVDHRPEFLVAALTRLRNHGTKEIEITNAIVNRLDTLAAEAKALLAWSDQVAVGDLLPLQPADKQLQSVEHREMCEDPLPFLTSWMDNTELPSRFSAQALRDPGLFTDSLVDLLFADLAREFGL